MKITLRGHAGIRHYFPDAQPEYQMETETEMSLGAICNRLGIPISEVMLMTIGNQAVSKDHIPSENDMVEIFPILAGG